MELEKYLLKKEELEEKEASLSKKIVSQNAEILADRQRYTELLKEGKEEEADKLFSKMYKQKEENQSTHAKLDALKPIHEEMIQELAIKALNSDLPVLRQQYESELEIIFKEMIQLDKRKKELVSKQEDCRVAMRIMFADYEDLFEDNEGLAAISSELKQLQNTIGSMGSRIINETNSKIMKSEGRL